MHLLIINLAHSAYIKAVVMKSLCTIVAVFLGLLMPGLAQVSPTDLIADIDQLDSLISNQHVRPFRLVTEAEFRSTVAEAKAAIDVKASCDESCFVELLKVVAALRDGHSVVRSGSREKLFGYLPITTTWFEEGLYVTRVPEQHRGLLGGRLEAINNRPIADVLDALRTVLPHGNDSRFKKFAYAYLRMPGLLYGLGITDNPLGADFTLTVDGESRTATFQHMSDEEYEQTNFIHYDDTVEQLPLYRARPDDFYWYQYDSLSKVFYFNYSRVGNMDDERAFQFAARMWAVVDSLEVDKFIMDIRDNGGGQFAYSMSFIQGILDRPAINQHGKLFVISGYNTFSAALDMLRILEVQTSAIIIGEPPGDYAASSGDPETYELERSGIEVQLSSVFHASVFMEDMRPNLILDQVIPLSWADYQRGEDAALFLIANDNLVIPRAAPVEPYEDYLGRYEYDEDHHLILKGKDDELWIELSQSLYSPLYPTEDNEFGTEIQGLSVVLRDDQLQLNLSGSSSQYFDRTEDKMSGVDFLYAGDFATAKEWYSAIKAKDPKHPALGDGRFSELALFAFFAHRNEDRERAAEIAKGILNLGIELNDGDAPSCEFALRFY